jgi:hypothetical protein
MRYPIYRVMITTGVNPNLEVPVKTVDYPVVADYRCVGSV